ncbi:HprK-related kinase A [Massilia varians]|uniref:HprK-related kinase A n=1 Tax=Massilia varians TaxID=457921 RepID=UPI0025522A0F|nr:HprK-related kinase A [Massilia varians]MDK6078697.1 HprK-related kinase A [Massilia varians]
MLTLASLGRGEMLRRLALSGPGLVLRTGPFRSRIHTDIAHLADAIALLYADYPVEGEDGFADFQLAFRRSGGLRRWYRPQVRFDSDGQAPFQPLPLEQALPMFEWVMNWCVSHHAHGYLIIHAAVLQRGNAAVILPAPPGSGKSTLCAALASRGWRLLSDELTLVRPQDLALLPLARPVSLKNASIGVLRSYAPNAVFGPEVHGTSKGTIAHMRAPGASVVAAAEPARATHVVFPRYEADAPASLVPMPKARLFTGMVDNAFNYAVLGGQGFDVLGRLVEGCSGYTFSYGRLDDAMAVFDGFAGGSA